MPSFGWTAALSKICDNLIEIIMVNSFCMCKCKGTTANHLLLHHAVAFETWPLVFSRFGVNLVMLELQVKCFFYARRECLVSKEIVQHGKLFHCVYCGHFDVRGIKVLSIRLKFQI